MNAILKQLTEIEAELKKPFPTRDINKICEDFRTEFLNLSVRWISMKIFVITV